MAPGQSELAPKNELFTQVSLHRFRGAYVFLTRKSFIIHRRSDGDFKVLPNSIFDLDTVQTGLQPFFSVFWALQQHKKYLA